jgi:hypothetical protein
MANPQRALLTDSQLPYMHEVNSPMYNIASNFGESLAAFILSNFPPAESAGIFVRAVSKNVDLIRKISRQRFKKKPHNFPNLPEFQDGYFVQFALIVLSLGFKILCQAESSQLNYKDITILIESEYDISPNEMMITGWMHNAQQITFSKTDEVPQNLANWLNL